jgi:prepilin signal peptidase PulO-like enzyme (type II secretory pathway)
MYIGILAGICGLLTGAVFVYIAEVVMAHRHLARPRCPYCTALYHPVQWVAVVGFLTGQHRCRTCGKYLRIPRLIGEFYIALSWALLTYYYPGSSRLWLSLLASIPLAMVIVTDLEAKLIPNIIILPSIAVMLVLGTVLGPALPGLESWHWWDTLAGALVGFASLRILIWIGVALFGEGALGEGDMTLATYVGAIVGFPIIVEALILTVVMGGIGAIVVLIAKRGSLKSAMPYGPFIALGASVCMLWGAAILHWYIS